MNQKKLNHKKNQKLFKGPLSGNLIIYYPIFELYFNTLFYHTDSRVLVILQDFYFRWKDSNLPNENAIPSIKKYYEGKLELVYELVSNSKIAFILHKLHIELDNKKDSYIIFIKKNSKVDFIDETLEYTPEPKNYLHIEDLDNIKLLIKPNHKYGFIDLFYKSGTKFYFDGRVCKFGIGKDSNYKLKNRIYNNYKKLLYISHRLLFDQQFYYNSLKYLIELGSFVKYSQIIFLNYFF